MPTTSWSSRRPAGARVRPTAPASYAAQRTASPAGVLGGADLNNLTGLSLEALLDPALAFLAVDVVLGLQSPPPCSGTSGGRREAAVHR